MSTIISAEIVFCRRNDDPTFNEWLVVVQTNNEGEYCIGQVSYQSQAAMNPLGLLQFRSPASKMLDEIVGYEVVPTDKILKTYRYTAPPQTEFYSIQKAILSPMPSILISA